jgi:NAD(P)H-dependent FMN reductase
MISVIVGTHRPSSNALRVASYYLQTLRQQGLVAELIELERLPHDFLFTDSFAHRSDAFRPFEQQMRASRAFVFVAPEYNGSYPGVLKAFIDSMNPKDVFHGKRAGLIGESTGRFGNVRGLDHLAGVLNYLRVDTMAFRAHIMRVDQKFDAQNQVSDPATATELTEHLHQFVRFIGPEPLA